MLLEKFDKTKQAKVNYNNYYCMWNCRVTKDERVNFANYNFSSSWKYLISSSNSYDFYIIIIIIFHDESIARYYIIIEIYYIKVCIHCHTFATTFSFINCLLYEILIFFIGKVWTWNFRKFLDTKLMKNHDWKAWKTRIQE